MAAQTAATTQTDGVIRPSGGGALLIDGKRASEEVLATIAAATRDVVAHGL